MPSLVTFPLPRPVLATLLMLAGPSALLLTACGGGGTTDRASAEAANVAAGTACVSTDSTPVGLAVLGYSTTAVECRRHRFRGARGRLQGDARGGALVLLQQR